MKQQATRYQAPIGGTGWAPSSSPQISTSFSRDKLPCERSTTPVTPMIAISAVCAWLKPERRSQLHDHQTAHRLFELPSPEAPLQDTPPCRLTNNEILSSAGSGNNTAASCSCLAVTASGNASQSHA